ncbi:MAG: type IV pilus modification protein PilV [Methylobacillus sp.]|jgi:type IV pilus assembly protein PilV|nr:type IV pilus modification protein PilV [Methylobacillus sp.]
MLTQTHISARASRPKKQRGITLLESLVALVVAALGILGIIGIQLRALSDTTTSVRREQAIRLIDDLSERMRVNPNALYYIDSYVASWDAAGTSCGAAGPDSSVPVVAADAASLATSDRDQWKNSVRCILPGGNANVFLAPADTDNTNRRLVGVMISWRQNEKSTDAAYTDPTNVVTSNGGGSATVSCPVGSTCHLQYISVAARCAAYLAGTNPQYSCSQGSK